MPKIKINTITKSNDEVLNKEYDAIMIDNKIKYQDENGLIIINIFDDYIKLERENLVLNFKEKKHTKGKVCLENNHLELNIYTNKLEKSGNIIEIDYNIEEQNINFKLYIK